MKFDYIIYHKNCFDGFSSFFLIHNKNLLTDDALIYPDYPYSKSIPPEIKDKNLIIVDVAYNIKLIKEIANQVKELYFIDHHISIHKDMENLQLPNTTVIYDKTKSGSRLIWDTFYNSVKIPAFIKYIEDYDTGKFSLNLTKQFMISLEVNYDLEPSLNNLVKWKKLFNKNEIKKLLTYGKFYLQYDYFLTDKNKKKYIITSFPSSKIYNEHNDIFDKIGQYTVALYSGTPCPSILSIYEKISIETNCDIFMIWNYNFETKEYIINMRSKKINTSEISKVFGGGGHEGASTFTTKYKIDDLFDEILGR